MCYHSCTLSSFLGCFFQSSHDQTWNNVYVICNRCGHCKKLAPEYEKLGTSFKKAKSVLIGKVHSIIDTYWFFLSLSRMVLLCFFWVLAFYVIIPWWELRNLYFLVTCSGCLQVDCDEHKSLCSKYGVSGYPTIQWFPKGSLEPKKWETTYVLIIYVNTSKVIAFISICMEHMKSYLVVFIGMKGQGQQNCLQSLWIMKEVIVFLLVDLYKFVNQILTKWKMN